jgi:hypothetical protein
MDKALGGLDRCASLESLLALSDCVSLHANATKENEKMVGVSALAAMKRGRYAFEFCIVACSDFRLRMTHLRLNSAS